MWLNADRVTQWRLQLMLITSNTAALDIDNTLNATTVAADQALQQLSSGQRINSGADDGAGLSIASGLDANVAALNQSAQNVTDGIGMIQTADGALSQITTLLNRSVSLATAAANGTLTMSESQAVDHEFQALLAEINSIAADTQYDGQPLFSLALGVADRVIDNGSLFDVGNTIYGTSRPPTVPLTIFTSDGTAHGSTTFVYSPFAVDARSLGLTADHSQTDTGAPLDFAANLTLLTGSQARTALVAITSAISQISVDRESLGGLADQLQVVSAVDATESPNLQSASIAITSTDVGFTVTSDTKSSVLEQTGVYALMQSDTDTRNILKLINSVA